jgi:hypothetical protein
MTATGGRVWFIWVTAHYPDVDHAVSDEESAARNVENRGEYRALCGAVFLPAPSSRPPGPACPACDRFLRARVTLPELQKRPNQRYRDRRAEPEGRCLLPVGHREPGTVRAGGSGCCG